MEFGVQVKKERFYSLFSVIEGEYSVIAGSTHVWQRSMPLTDGQHLQLAEHLLPSHKKTNSYFGGSLDIFISTELKVKLLLVWEKLSILPCPGQYLRECTALGNHLDWDFSLPKKCLKYFLNWGNRNLLLEAVSSATYKIHRETQKANSLDNEIKSLVATSEQ